MIVHLRQAESSDVPEIMVIIRQARAFLGAQGLNQWQHAYPAKADILSDLTKAVGHVLTVDEEVAGYCAIITGEEPAYTAITDGAWSNASRDYVTVHRIAISDKFRGLGLTKKLWAEIYQQMADKGYHDFRVDTHEENRIMQRMLTREGFVKRGIVMFEGPRWAYQKENKKDE